MPKVQAVNRRALVLSKELSYLLENPRAGDFCFEFEKPAVSVRETFVVLYLMVPGEDRELDLVKLYMKHTETRWDEPGNIVAWDGCPDAPSLDGLIQTPHWLGLFMFGRLWSEHVERD